MERFNGIPMEIFRLNFVLFAAYVRFHILDRFGSLGLQYGFLVLVPNCQFTTSVFGVGFSF